MFIKVLKVIADIILFILKAALTVMELVLDIVLFLLKAFCTIFCMFIKMTPGFTGGYGDDYW